MNDSAKNPGGIPERVTALEEAVAALQKNGNDLAERLAKAEKSIVLLTQRLTEVEHGVVKSGDTVSLKCKGEFATWMTGGGEIKSRGTDYIGEFQGWQIQRR